MKASLLTATILSLMPICQPVLVEGTPGLGKTQLLESVCAAVGYTIPNGSYVHLHGPTLQPEDMGMPAVDVAARTHSFTTPDWFPAVGRPGPDRGAIVIDELASGDTAIQKTLANMIQQRELHGVQMKPGWIILATGNRQEDGAGANRVLSHLRDRLLTLPFDPDLNDWIAWASKHGVRNEVISFLRWRPDLLTNFSKDNKINATPRGWAEGVSRYLGVVPIEAELECFEGRVGQGPAAEFVGFMRTYRSLPDPDALLRDPLKAKVDYDTSTMFALCGAIAQRATTKNIKAVLQFARRLPPEFTVLVVRDATARDESLINTPDFIDWAVKEGGDTIL